MRTKTLWIKDGYLQFILAGRKTIEVRRDTATSLAFKLATVCCSMGSIRVSSDASGAMPALKNC